MTLNRPLIKFTHEEVEALLRVLDDYECEVGKLSSIETSCKDKLKRIYARQILSFEKKQEFEAAAKESE